MQKVNITYVLCQIGGIAQYQWIADAIDKSKFNLSFIFLDNTTDVLKASLIKNGFTCYQLNVTSKKNIPKAIYQTIKIFKKENTTVVHTHLVDASLVGLLAAKLLNIKTRIHTRHHANFHHEHYKKGVYADNLINYLSTKIIVISKNVQQIVEQKEKYHTNKIKRIYHGFKLDDFDNISAEKINQLKTKYQLHKFPVIGMVARYMNGKGIKYAIEAVKKLLLDFPDAKLVIANAFGAEKESIQQILRTLPAENYIEIEFESEIKTLYKCFDIFVHVPIDVTYEAFGQVYIEAMAASIPGVYTLSGIATEYIKNNKNAIVVDYKNSEQIYTAIKKYINNTDFKNNIIKEAKKDVMSIFGFDKMMIELNTLYLPS